ncbi:MAG: D-alanyl-D-alanine carboxypeptidase [Cellulosilyticum sp.]|nr:D-alanyl-D-alanine carboxypeptidase [Cellulosilyticum sp.]
MFRKCVTFLLSSLLICHAIFASPLPEVSADGAFLIETNTNTILYSKNGNLTFYPASTTKVLTSLAIANDLPLNQVITKSQDAVTHVPSDSSQIGLGVGDQYSVYDGLHAVLMSSDNFVCYDLALADSGSISAFAQKMNALAANADPTANSKDYNFVNPHGYHDENHFTTPHVLAQITAKAFDNPIVSKIAGTLNYNFNVLNTGQTIPLKHTSALLDSTSPYYNEHVVASKTGYHTPAKRTLVAKANYGNMSFIGVIMRTDAPLQFEDMNKLFSYASENFQVKTDSTGISYLENNTSSEWAKPYINEALINGWITSTSYNFTHPITKRMFLNLLRSATPATYNEYVDELLHSNNSSIYNENLSITRAELATTIYKYLSHFELYTIPSNLAITDINSLSTSTQEAIIFCLQSGIMHLSDENKFLPNDSVSYEEAVYMISIMNGILDRYNNFSL